MQSIWLLTVFAVVLICSPLQGAEMDDIYNCSRWKTLPETARLLYLVGYSQGVGRRPAPSMFRATNSIGRKAIVSAAYSLK